MNLIPLLSIPVLYFLGALLKDKLPVKIAVIFCPICVAVSLSWLGLLVLWLTGTDVSITVLGILLGMSITGVMYKMEEIYRNKKLRNFWIVRLSIIVGGFYAVSNLLEKKWNIFVLIVISLILLIAIVSFLLQKNERRNSVAQKLDDCC